MSYKIKATIKIEYEARLEEYDCRPSQRAAMEKQWLLEGILGIGAQQKATVTNFKAVKTKRKP